MTGYGRGTGRNGDLSIIVELNAVNRKGLDVSASLPRDWLGMERVLCDQVRKAVSRGKVSILLRVEKSDSSAGLTWDDIAVQSSLDRLKALAAKTGVDFKPDADALLRLVGLMDNTSGLPDWESAMPVVEPAFREALDAFLAMRATEGAALVDDMRARIEQLRGWTKAISEISAGTVPRFREQLLERLQKASLELDISDERVLKEIALFADRCDIAEEQTRLDSHLSQFEAALGADDAIGRKLDFLCQEIFREINTIGSKANNIEITRHVIEMKNELERIREQVQNVE